MPPGRETLLTEQTQSTIVQAIASGAPLEVCAQYAGISKATFWRWMELGKPDQPCVPEDDPEHTGKGHAPPAHPVGECPVLAPHRDFRAAVQRAEHQLHVLLAGHVVKAAPRDHRAALEMLRRKWPKTWNVPTITQLEGGLEVEVTLTARDRVRTKLEELAARGLLALPEPASDDGDLDREEEMPDERATPRRRSPRARDKADTVDTTASETRSRPIVA